VRAQDVGDTLTHSATIDVIGPQHMDELLAECGCTTLEIDSLRASGAVG